MSDYRLYCEIDETVLRELVASIETVSIRVRAEPNPILQSLVPLEIVELSRERAWLTIHRIPATGTVNRYSPAVNVDVPGWVDVDRLGLLDCLDGWVGCGIVTLFSTHDGIGYASDGCFDVDVSAETY